MPRAEELQQGFRIGEFEVFPARGVLRHGDIEEVPEPLVFKLLMALAVRDGDVASKEDLVAEVWDGYPIGDDSITRCVAQLRKHLGEHGKAYVKTMTKRGYRLDEKIVLQGPQPLPDDDRQQAVRLLNQGRLWMLAAMVVAAIIFWTVLDPDDGGRSVGVLPFENLGDDPADPYLVEGLKLELVHTLGNIPDFSVKNVRGTFDGREVTEVARALDVDFILTGKLQRAGDTLRVAYLLEKGSNGKTISSGEVTGPVGDVFRLQADLAILLRNDLVGESPQQLISQSRNPNSLAFDAYMRGMHAFERRGRGSLDNLNAARMLFEESIELDPSYGPAYLGLAAVYALLPDYENAPLAEAHQRALELASRAIEVDDGLADAASEVQGFVYQKQRQWALAEEAYLRATGSRVVDSTAFNWYSLMLAGVGRVEDALEQILLAQKIDPSSAVINSRTAIIYTWLGESERAEEYFARASQLGASGEIHMLGRVMLLIRAGQYEEAARLTGAGVSLAGGRSDWIEPLFAAVSDPSVREQALAAIAAAFEDTALDPRLEIIARVMLEDIDGAMGVAMSLVESGRIFEMDFLFLPELEPLRSHPGFMELMDGLGVTKYWQNRGCVWKDDRLRCAS
ncbi:MAG: hypothetical protein GTO71_02135 [Woeseiaceae bacterium]|nr:hypothetical protein [Woeseiaceae bacterium]NIP19909.1 hypothetical protein [Woeseiaceae bacterium]NIS88710.1 hypothetical protein [Woeseiaceae bacterium]